MPASVDNNRGLDQSAVASAVVDAVNTAHTGDLERLGNTTNTKEESSSASSSSDALSLEQKEDREVEAHPDQVTEGTSLGVQKAEAAALVWSKKAVYLTYAWIWVCYFMLALQQNISSNVMAYAYTTFATAPQIATATVVAAIIGGVLRLPIAKSLNVWGRAEGFLVFVVVYLLGIIIIASCNGPDSYAAGYTLYWIGYDAIYMILNIFVADTSGLRNRAFAFGFVTTPFICTAFTGPLAATSFVARDPVNGWRWANGAFAIVMPFVFVPLAVVFKFFQRKAEKQGLFVRERSGRNAAQSLVYYFHEFDVVGAILLMAAFVLVLLPFSLRTNGRMQYKSGGFIAMEVIGFLLFPVFAAWEKYATRAHFVRWEIMKKPTVFGAAILMGFMYFSFYCWDTYYYSFISVVYNLDARDTGYMLQIYNVGSCLWSPLFGIWIRLQKHFKWPTMAGLLLMLLGSGLMIHFRGDNQGIGYLIMSQIFVAFGGGSVVIGSDMAVMAAGDRDGVPLMLSILGLSTSVGGAIGGAVIGAVYASDFPKTLRAHLPAPVNETLVQELYNGGYLVQETYLRGTPVRSAVDEAWRHTQKLGTIASTCLLVGGIPCLLMWKNYNVNRKQNKGQVI